MDMRDVAQMLSGRAEEFCRHFLPAGKRDGQRWRVGSVYNDPGDSMNVELSGPKAGQWYDHAAKDGGDLLEVLVRQGPHTKQQAADIARDWLRVEPFKPNGNHRPAFDPLTYEHFKLKRCPNACWEYRDIDGNLIGWACRFNHDDGGKDVFPLRWIDGKPKWLGWAKSRDERKPIYGIHTLKQRADAPVLIVEGEKTADAAQRLFQDLVVITWQSGASAVADADWETVAPLLAGRKLYLWPDNDPSGIKAMNYLRTRFSGSLMVDTSLLPPKWDLADPAPADVDLRALIDAASDPKPAKPNPGDSRPFRILGYDESQYFYLPFRSGIIRSFSAPEHTELNLNTLANDDYWESCHPGKHGADYKAAAKRLIADQECIGFFDEDKVRGLGCWIDGDRVVFHAGDRLFVNGANTPLHQHDSAFIYPRRKRIDVSLDQCASIEECSAFVHLCSRFTWKSREWFWLLPAYAFIAPVCGALDWRPHLWICGESSAGKSWLYSNVLVPLLGNTALRAVSVTTEAGIRQALGCDALNVIFDEIESKDDRANVRIQHVLELMRQASCETGGAILKGNTDGHARSYKIRSSFCLSSVSSPRLQPADESRISQIELVKSWTGDSKEWKATKALWRESVARPEICDRIRARSVSMAHIIRESSKTFTDLIAAHAGDARVGQQYGSLAAGLWCLENDQAPTVVQAEMWVSTFDWKTLSAKVSSGTDQEQARDVLLQGLVPLQDADGRSHQRSVGELLQIVRNSEPEAEAAIRALLHRGINYNRSEDAVEVACSNNELGKLFGKTHYADNWKRFFQRLNGAKDCFYQYLQFGVKTTRAVRVPWTQMFP